MAQFTTRVELHNANGDDYEHLHEEMKAEGFVLTVTSDDDITYHLPPAEYNYEGELSRKDVLAKAKRAASAVKKSFAILVTESKGRSWSGLEKL